jgi:hypothetical protein
MKKNIFKPVEWDFVWDITPVAIELVVVRFSCCSGQHQSPQQERFLSNIWWSPVGKGEGLRDCVQWRGIPFLWFCKLRGRELDDWDSCRKFYFFVGCVGLWVDQRETLFYCLFIALAWGRFDTDIWSNKSMVGWNICPL